jgi:hypothetical protein
LGWLCMKSKNQIKTFSEASRLKPVPQLEQKSIPQDACDA